MKTIKVYSASELKDKFPEAFEKVLEKWQYNCKEDIFWGDEIFASMKETFEAAGLTLTNWELGTYSPCFVRFTMPTYWSELAEVDMLVENYEGKRALKWLKEAFGLKSVKRVNYIGHDKKKHFRYDIVKTDGEDWSCEFTGYCADHDYIESLLEDVSKNGCTLEDAFSNLAKVYGKLIEQELENQQSEEYFLEHAGSNEFSYTEHGVRI